MKWQNIAYTANKINIAYLIPADVEGVDSRLERKDDLRS